MSRASKLHQELVQRNLPPVQTDGRAGEHPVRQDDEWGYQDSTEYEQWLDQLNTGDEHDTTRDV